jgi:hypothetical protein
VVFLSSANLEVFDHGFPVFGRWVALSVPTLSPKAKVHTLCDRRRSALHRFCETLFLKQPLRSPNWTRSINHVGHEILGHTD